VPANKVLEQKGSWEANGVELKRLVGGELKSELSIVLVSLQLVQKVLGCGEYCVQNKVKSCAARANEGKINSIAIVPAWRVAGSNVFWRYPARTCMLAGLTSMMSVMVAFVSVGEGIVCGV